ncbi:unnamed protein product [Candidula unifasciata]|uniref:Uncharacterized protein n=1 Tax=Candidula unifasciata TaxID=100452 RepID=A0A8S3ZJE9_9EUPU|nr:unnamed protein product [Candidula unifasciata]
MPECRRDQTRFIVFLAVMMTVETAVIFAIMHWEHKNAEHQAQERLSRQRAEHATPHLLHRDEKPSYNQQRISDKRRNKQTWKHKNKYKSTDSHTGLLKNKTVKT